MLTSDVIKKIKRIEITTKHQVQDLFSGQYHSVFKGQGIEFQEVREYIPGDDVRNIDWNVTARYGFPYIKKYREERELSVMILVDLSSSQKFGTAQKLKQEIAAEISAVLAFSAIQNNDKVGLLIFTDQIEKVISPQKGRYHVLRLIREVLYFHPRFQGTNLALALESADRMLNRRSIIFLISDFIDTGYEKQLKIASRRHDIIGIRIKDPRERKLPRLGLVEMEDAETGQQFTIDTSDPRLQRQFGLISYHQEEEWKRLTRQSGLDHIEIDTSQSYVNPLVKFFRGRAKRYR
ncbi:MAG: DUF58 domain-containing protein [candidate division Zixibacteria bacterium]|nr:DUF58 domain-containing protein [candidate division Zixibacteria bacterium]